MGLTHILHNIFNGLKHAFYPIVNFLYYNEEEVFATTKIVSLVNILLMLVSWFYKLYMLFAISLLISIIGLIITIATALIVIWK
jgi:hypothetical protein